MEAAAPEPQKFDVSSFLLSECVCVCECPCECTNSCVSPPHVILLNMLMILLKHLSITTVSLDTGWYVFGTYSLYIT